MVPDSIARVVPARFAGADLFVLAIWWRGGSAGVHYGLAHKWSGGGGEEDLMGISRGDDVPPDGSEQDRADGDGSQAIVRLGRLAEDWTNGVDHGMAWPLKIVATKHRAVERLEGGRHGARAGRQVRDRCVGIERLFRDARLGRIHPASPALAHEIVGKMSLGISPDEQPRWG
jgi:hypothetical protein